MSNENTPSESSPLLADSHHTYHSNEGIEHGTIRASDNDGGHDGEELTAVAESPTTLQLVLVLSGPWLGCFLAALDSTVIATLSAPISASFNSLSMLSWIASSYLIASAAIQPISGRLTDILSRKTGLLFSIGFFAIGNLVCGVARTKWIMIIGRVIAGIGGGGINAVCTFLGSDYIPLRRRGLWQGIGNVVYGMGAGLGGVVGGWINDIWDWRVAFLIIVPFTILSGVLVFFTIHTPVTQPEEEVRQEAWARIDFLGAFTLIGSLVLLLLGLNSGGNIVPWNHPLVLTALPLSAVFFGIFIYVEKSYAKEPILPLHLMLNQTILAACLTNWFGSMTYFSTLFYGPIYFQVKGLSTTQAGLNLVPSSLGAAIGSVTTGLVMRSTGRYYLLSIAVQIIFVTALIIFSTFTLTSAPWKPFVSFFFSGMAYSGMLTVTLLALISAVDQQHQALVTSASYAFRSTGSTIGITIASAVFQNILDMKLWALLGDQPGAAEIIDRLKSNLEEMRKLPDGWEEVVMKAYMDALRGVFLTILGVGVLGMLASLAMREHVLHTTMARK